MPVFAGQFLFADKHMRNVLKVIAAVATLSFGPLAVAGTSPSVAPAPGLAGAPITAETFTPVVTGNDFARRANVHLGSRSVLVVRADNGEVLYRKNVDRDMPIASITKLMTAMVVLDAGLPLDEVITVSQADVDTIKHTHSRLLVGTRLTRGDLLLLALMASENRAAAALARSYPGGKPAAVAAMNHKAVTLGMTHSRFVDGTGLSSNNTASPVDLVRLVKAAESYQEIRTRSTTAQHTVQVGRRMQVFRNTNPLVKSPDWSINLTKTGFINEAGRCLVMQARIAELPVILVLMDSTGKKTRLGDANRVRKWLEETLRLGSLARAKRDA